MELSQTKKAQMDRWTNMIESEDFKRVCRQSDWNPTDERLNEIKLDVFEVSEEHRKIKDNAYIRVQKEKIHRKCNEEGVLITLCLDQSLNEVDAIEAQYNVIEEIRKAGYKWLVDARICFEYWGKTYNDDYHKEMDDMESEQKLHENGNFKWNPHIHISCRRIGKESVIRQNLIRKFVSKKLYGVYRIDVKRLEIAKAIDYVMGVKCEGKMEQVKMDNDIRNKYGVEGTIYI